MVQRTGPIRKEVEKNNCTSLMEGDCAEKGQTVEVDCGKRENKQTLSVQSQHNQYFLYSLSHLFQLETFEILMRFLYSGQLAADKEQCLLSVLSNLALFSLLRLSTLSINRRAVSVW